MARNLRSDKEAAALYVDLDGFKKSTTRSATAPGIGRWRWSPPG